MVAVSCLILTPRYGRAKSLLCDAAVPTLSSVEGAQEMLRSCARDSEFSSVLRSAYEKERERVFVPDICVQVLGVFGLSQLDALKAQAGPCRMRASRQQVDLLLRRGRASQVSSTVCLCVCVCF
jgi:hypothetical protein